VEREGKNLTTPLTFVLSRKGRGKKEDGNVLMDKIKGEFGQWEGYGKVIRTF
jgi:hypothetical protein